MNIFRGITERVAGDLGRLTGEGDREAMLAHYDRSFELLTKCGAENEAAHTLVAKARGWRMLGDLAAARDCLRLALATYERLGTAGEPDEARAILAECEQGA